MSDAGAFEIGVFIFGELTKDSVGRPVFGVGEHHRQDFAATSPQLMLAAVAAQSATEILPAVRAALPARA